MIVVKVNRKINQIMLLRLFPRKKFVIPSLLLLGMLSVSFAMPVSVNADHCPDDQIETSFAFGGKTCLAKTDGNNINNNPILIMVFDFLKFFSALVGLAVTGGVIYGGILYSTAQGNPGQTQKAITVITNSIAGLLLYILMFAIINFMVPGGLFR